MYVHKMDNSELFKQLEYYWGKTIIYKFPKQDPDTAYYVEDYFYRASNFSNYIDISESSIDAQLGIIEFEFMICEDFYVDEDFNDDTKLVILEELEYFKNYSETDLMKCINGCGFNTKIKSDRDFNNIETLYCNVCLGKIKIDDHKKQYKLYLENNKIAYMKRYNELMEFLKNPLPKKIYLSQLNGPDIEATLVE